MHVHVVCTFVHVFCILGKYERQLGKLSVYILATVVFMGKLCMSMCNQEIA